MLKKIKNSLFILGLVAALVTGLSSCGGNELKVDPSIVIGPGNATTILGEDTSVAVLLADFKDTPEKVDLFKKDAEEATATDLTVKDNAIVIPTASWAAGAYEIYVQAEDVKSNVITLAIAKNANEKIIISPAVSGQKGDTLSIVVAFSNLKAEPSTVDVWVENAEEALAKGLDVTNNTISLSTSDLDSGSTNIYVVAGDLKSSTCAITLTTPPAPEEKPAKTPAITIEGPKKVSQGNDYQNKIYLNMTFKDIEGYDFLKHPKVSLYVDGIYKNNYDITSNKCEIGYNYLANLETGKHKVYLTMKDPDVKSNELEIEVVDGFVDPEVTIKKSDIKNKVELTWYHSGAYYYNIYFSNQNDISTATRDARKNCDNELEYSYLFPTSATNGKYYFWIVPSNSSSEPVAADITTEPVEYTFTRDSHTAPTGLNVTPVTGKANVVSLTWDDNKAAYYAVYYGSDSDFSNANRFNSGAYTKEGLTCTLSSNGTYYFWVKPYDNSYSEDTPVSEAKAYEFTYTKPDKVTKVSAQAYTGTKNSVKITWTESNAANYRVRYSASNDFSKAISVNTYGKDYAYQYYLPAAGKYYFWVIATDNGNYTEEDAVKVEYTLATYDNGGIPTPGNVTVAEYSSNTSRIEIKCDEVTIPSQSYTYYWFYYSETNDPKTATSKNYTTSPSYTYPKSYFKSNTTYYFWVKAATANYTNSTSSNFSEAFAYIPNPTTE